MFGGVNVWRIAKLEIGKIKFGELIDFSHKDAIYKLNFGWLKFGEPWTIRHICQNFPPPNVLAIYGSKFKYCYMYLLVGNICSLLLIIQSSCIANKEYTRNCWLHKINE